jgi:tRNA (guanine37-N1)-methyltransferase
MSIRIDVVTGFPKLVEGPLNESILKRARDKGLAEIVVHDLREYTADRHRTIDDTPYGGGAGMILKPEPVFACVETLQRERRYDEVIYLSADGERLSQQSANRLSLNTAVILICGHYKGIDERIRRALVTREISIGDYVLTGGEIPALAIIDAVARLLPGVLGDEGAAADDSHATGLLEYPHYTRPAEFRGWSVPEVLTSGDHARVAAWRREQSLRRTLERRPDLIAHAPLTAGDRQVLARLAAETHTKPTEASD